MSCEQAFLNIRFRSWTSWILDTIELSNKVIWWLVTIALSCEEVMLLEECDVAYVYVK